MIRNIRKIMVAGLLLMAGAMNALAENVLSIGGYDILPGESKTLTVDMTNTEGIAVLQFFIELPEGLLPDGDEKTWYVRNEDRINGISLTVIKRSDSRYEVLVYNPLLKIIAGKEGTILSLKVKAAADYDTKGKIRIASLKSGTDEAGSKGVVTVGDTGLYTGEFSNKQVQPLIQLDAETIKGITDGDVHPYALVDLTNEETLTSVTEVINDLNAAIDAQTLTRTEALVKLKDHIEYLEKKEGDVNLDGEFNILDVNDSFNDNINGNDGFDFNGDGEFNILDTNDLFNKAINQ